MIKITKQRAVDISIVLFLLIFGFFFLHQMGFDSGTADSMAQASAAIDFSRLEGARDAIAHFPASGQVTWRQPRFNRSTISFAGRVEDMKEFLVWRAAFWPEIAADLQQDLTYYEDFLGKKGMGFSGLLPGAKYSLDIKVSREFTLDVDATKPKKTTPIKEPEML